MKKIFSFVLAICLIIPCAMFFVGCGGPEGIYQLSEIAVTQGDTVTTLTRDNIADYLDDAVVEDENLQTFLDSGFGELLNYMVGAMFDMQLEIKGNGEMTMVQSGEESEDSETQTAFWKLEGSTFIFSETQDFTETQEYTYSNGTLSMEEDTFGVTMKIVFARV